VRAAKAGSAFGIPRVADTTSMKADSGPGEPAHARLHGRRKGKKLRPHQALLIDELLPRIAIDARRKIVDPADEFAARPSQIWLEIGFGGGEHLVGEAAHHRDRGFLGCEYFVNGIAKLLTQVDAEELDNLRVFEGDAADLIALLPDASLDGVYLLYPDPWPKRRQRKRRFVSDATLSQLARVMCSGAPLHFATDIDDYAGWTLARALRSPDFTWPAEASADWREPWPDWRATRYEAKALAAGRRPVYLTFVRM
jgi:tRNA (guanine-N7-)-methyltransferase